MRGSIEEIEDILYSRCVNNDSNMIDEIEEVFEVLKQKYS